MSIIEDNLLDKKVFDTFQELIGSNLNMVLLRHMEIAQEYINTMKESLKKSDFTAINDAAHPLNSSSRQIGAFNVADIAEEIEDLSKTPDPNVEILTDLIFKLQDAQSRVNNHIKTTIIL